MMQNFFSPHHGESDCVMQYLSLNVAIVGVFELHNQ